MKPERLERTTVDGSKLNLEALYQIAPSCFTEELDDHEGETIEVEKDGQRVRMAVNFKVLRELLGDVVADESEEMYQFTWPGKQAARREAAAPITDTLRPVPADSVDWDTTQNLYIEGDNLRVLKLLQKGYMGKVKMIYIDPPYNTGKDFVYHDDFAHTIEEENLAAGNVDEEGYRFRKNLDSNGRFHSDWCSMIYSRLLVARSLLTENGVIFISIDSHELVNLKKICDSIFGEANFIDIFNWAKTETPENLSKKSKQIIEYVLCYQKNKDTSKFQGIKKESVSSNGLLNQPNSVHTLVFPANKVRTSITNQIIPAGMYGTDAYDVELLEETEVKDGVFVKDVKLKARFKWNQDNLKQEISNGTIIRIPTLKFSPSYERAEYDAEVPANLINNKVGVETNETAGTYQLELFDKKVFNYPKPVSLIKYLLGFNDNEEEDTIVLDFFSGSATTAETVMRINSEKKKNHLHYIMIQLQENLYETEKASTSASEKEITHNAIEFLNSKHLPVNLCEIAKERIRRAGKKIKEESPLTTQDLDIGFRVFRLADSNYENVEKSPNEYDQKMLDLFADNIKTDRTDLDLLFGAMLSWGVQLSLPMTTEEVDGCKIYTVDGNGLVACFAENVTENVVKAMAAKNPLRVLFRDSCFSEDKTKINIFELFKQQLDWDESESMQNIRVI
jgi:type III DNA modification enzyme